MGKTVLVVFLLLMAPFILIVMSMMGLLSAFSGEGVLQTAENMDVTGTAIYQSVKEVTDPFYEQVSEQLEEEKKEIEKAHTYTEVTYDKEGNPSYEKKCSAIVYKQVNYTSAAYIVAYLSYAGGLDEKTGKIDQGKAKQFLEEICEVKSISSDDTHFVVKNEFASLDAIAETYFPDEKIRKNFIASYQAYSEYFAMDESGTIEGMEHPCPVMLYYRQSHFTCSTRIRGEARHMGMGQSGKMGAVQPVSQWCFPICARRTFIQMMWQHGQAINTM